MDGVVQKGKLTIKIDKLEVETYLYFMAQNCEGLGFGLAIKEVSTHFDKLIIKAEGHPL